jgi:hypothetical protein
MFSKGSRFTSWFKRATHKRERLAAKREVERRAEESR